MYQRPALQRLLNDSISWVASNHKMSEALSTQKTEWSSSLPLLPPQVPPSYSVIQVEHHTHTWTLLLPILPNTSPNSTSREVSCFSWWVKISSTDFMKLMITILFENKDKYLKCLLLKTKHTNATIKEKTPLTGWTEIFFHLVDTEKQETQYASVLSLVSRGLSWY